jgi:hypothetical protein
VKVRESELKMGDPNSLIKPNPKAEKGKYKK